MTAKTRVFLVDDHTIMRNGLVSLLGTCPEIDVIGASGDGDSALKEIVDLKPDVVIMDILMPGMDGIEATRRLVDAWPEAKVMALTTLGTSDAFESVMAAGALGAILKTADLPEMRKAIATVASGRRSISPEVEQIMADDPPLPHMTARQQEILRLAAKGLSNSDISKVVGVSAPVVNEHLRAAFSKLGAANRTEAVAIALRKNLM